MPTPPAAGQRITAALLGAINGNTSQIQGAQQSTSSITLTGTAQDLTGTSVTFSVAYACTMFVVASFDIHFTNGADIGVTGAVGVGTLVVDGVTQSGQCEFNGQNASNGQVWQVGLTAGSHTVKLQGARLGPGPTGSIQTLATHTRWDAFIPSP
jgi:hypothetical protein